MPRTSIIPNEVISAGSQANAANQKIVSAKNGVNDVNWRLDAKIKNRNNIGGRLNSLSNLIGEIESKVARIKSASDTNADFYQRADERIKSRSRDMATTIRGTVVP